MHVVERCPHADRTELREPTALEKGTLTNGLAAGTDVEYCKSVGSPVSGAEVTWIWILQLTNEYDSTWPWRGRIE